MSNLLKELKKAAVLFSVLYTATTITSSIWQLYNGQPTDTNVHLLLRGGVILIAVATIILFTKVKVGNTFVNNLVAYAFSMALVFLFVFLFGLTQPLHPDAYRDIFFNFTGVTVMVVSIMSIKDWIMAKRKSTPM